MRLRRDRDRDLRQYVEQNRTLKALTLRSTPPLLRDAPVHEDYLELPQAHGGEESTFDYASLRMTLRSYPLLFLRPALPALPSRRLLTSRQLMDVPDGSEVQTVGTVGLVTTRRRPETANGVIFVSLEDEDGEIKLIVYSVIAETPHLRPMVLGAPLMAVKGRWQRQGAACNIIAKHLEDLTPMLGELPTKSRDFK